MQGSFEDWRSRTFTPAEAAALVQLSPKQVRKELEYPVLGVRPGAGPRLPFSALIYFRALRLTRLSLVVADRVRLYRLISESLARAQAPERIEFASVLSLELGWLVSEMATTLARFEAWKGTLTTDPDVMAGEAVFPRSRVTVRHVGELLERGESPSILLEKYPELSPADIEFSPVFAKAYPRVGRPRVG